MRNFKNFNWLVSPQNVVFDASDVLPNFRDAIKVRAQDILPGDIIVNDVYFGNVCLGYSSFVSEESRKEKFKSYFVHKNLSTVIDDCFDIVYTQFAGSFNDIFEEQKKITLEHIKYCENPQNSFVTGGVVPIRTFNMSLAFSTVFKSPQNFSEPIEYVEKSKRYFDFFIKHSHIRESRKILSIETVEHGHMFINESKFPYFTVIRNY